MKKAISKQNQALNLLTDPWLLTTQGTVSMISALKHAKQLQLVGDAKFQVCALRLLLAACYVGGETSLRLLKNGVSVGTLEALQTHESRFDLRGGYWICPDLPGKTDSLSRLVSTASTNNNPVFHVHTRDDEFLILPDWQIANLTLEYQFFGLVAGNSALGYRFRSPGATAAIGLAKGQNLLETLALNLVPDAEPAVASWQMPNLKAHDLRHQTRPAPKSIAERYTWIAQGMRFEDEGIVTARGLKLEPLGDPMTAHFFNPKGEARVVKLIAENPYLTACALKGWRTTACPTLTHAATLGIDHQILVVAQRNEDDPAIRLVETRDGLFSVDALDFDLASKMERFYARLSSEHKKSHKSSFELELERFPRFEIANVFLSSVQDAIDANPKAKVEPTQVLSATLENLGVQGQFARFASMLEDTKHERVL